MASPSTALPYRLTLLASLAVHLLAAAALSGAGSRSSARTRSDLYTDRSSAGAAGRDTPATVDGVAVEETSIDSFTAVPQRASGDVVAHLDDGMAGRGGDPSARVPALNLADADERMRESPDLLNRLDRDQIQRLRASRARASWDDRRATTHPAELALVAAGPGPIHERSPSSPAAPDLGAKDPVRARREGSASAGFAFAHAEDIEGDPGGAEGDRIGSRMNREGAGLRHAPAGMDQWAGAPVGDARPSVVQARVAVPASERARTSDDVDSDQEVATIVRSLVHASTVGGTPGDKEGGTGGGAAAAAGGIRGAGSRARSLGEDGVVDYWTEDATLLPYFRQIHRRVDPLWANAFPKSALFELRQGIVILEFTIDAGGRVVVEWPPERSSGIDEFDRNCAEAIRRAAPFPPIPRELGVQTLRIRAPFVASNPIVK
ncbi:MAG TPA: energy transducer TonB [Polyangiaceae bacterium]|nr:energy transducer TonB [Polyangiaceae bacterium]